MARKKSDEVYVAKESGHAEIDGQEYVFHRGRTRVSGDSVVAKMKGFDQLFEPADEHLSYQTEEATARPGERRDVFLGHETGQWEAETAALEERTVAELRERAREVGVTPGTMNKAELVEAIAAAEEGEGEE